MPAIPEGLSRAAAKSFRHLPTNLLSRSWGRFTRTRASKPLIRPFALAFGIEIAEAEKELDEYSSLNEFFTRRLRRGTRPIDRDHKAVVSPVDGTVSAWGECDDDRLLQIKGVQYQLFGLLRDGPKSRLFTNGTYLTLYLSPRDYHRIHAPVDLEITGLGYMPGTLLPVNPPSVRWIPELYTRNERIMLYADSPCGPTAMVLVGAQCVGSISLTFNEIVTNRAGAGPMRMNFKRPIYVSKGEEVGAFEMGSTVVILFTQGKVRLELPSTDLPIRYGQRIGSSIDSGKDEP